MTEPTSASTREGSEPQLPTPPQRDLWISLGLGISAIAAAFSSYDSLRNLAEVAGWSPYMAPLFALSIDSYALAAIRVWLKSSKSSRAAAFAKRNAVGAVVLSLAGNGTYHLVAAGLMEVTWVLVMVVGSIPPGILGLVTHLSVLRKHGDSPLQTVNVLGPQHVPVPGPSQASTQMVRTQSSDDAGQRQPARAAKTPAPGNRNEAKAIRRSVPLEELLSAARQADAIFREQYGRGITRDHLRTALKVSGTKATEVLHRLRAEQHAHAEQPHQ